MKTIKFTIHGIPQAKGRARMVTQDKQGNPLASPHVYTPEKTRTAEAEIWVRSYNQRPRGDKPDGPVKLKVAVFRPWLKKDLKKANRVPSCLTIGSRLEQADPGANNAQRTGDSDLKHGPWAITKPDWDNYGKLVSDALNGLYWKDDSQIVDARVTKQYSDKPRIEVTITYIKGRK